MNALNSGEDVLASTFKVKGLIVPVHVIGPMAHVIIRFPSNEFETLVDPEPIFSVVVVIAVHDHNDGIGGAFDVGMRIVKTVSLVNVLMSDD